MKIKIEREVETEELKKGKREEGGNERREGDRRENIEGQERSVRNKINNDNNKEHEEA